MSEWQPIETAPDTPHFRGLWVRHQKTSYRNYWYWDCCAGFIDDEDGRWKTLSGDDCGWEAEDFTHWLPFPQPPEEKQ